MTGRRVPQARASREAERVERAAAEQLRRIRGVHDRHHLTLLCRDLSEVGSYARVDNRQYRLLKAATPGPFTFILDATKEVPRRVSHPSRKTIGIRIPDHPVALGLLDVLGQALLSTTLLLPGDELPLCDGEYIAESFGQLIGFDCVGHKPSLPQFKSIYFILM